MNEEGEVVIFDGVHTLYAVPFLSLSETYEKGKEFLNGENLTQERRLHLTVTDKFVPVYYT